MTGHENQRFSALPMELIVTAAITLDQRIRQDEKALKELKDELAAGAEECPDKTATDGGGWSVVFTGKCGGIARVTQPADKLKASVDAEKPKGAKLMELVGKRKDDLFLPHLKYVPVENFRDRVDELFDAGKRRRILDLMLSESSPSVSFETKEPEVRL